MKSYGRMRAELARDERGIIAEAGAAMLANPIVIMVLLGLLVILALTGAIMVFFTPHIVAAGLLVLVAGWLLIRAPLPDWRVRYGVPLALIVLAVIIYLYHGQLFGVV